MTETIAPPPLDPTSEPSAEAAAHPAWLGDARVSVVIPALDEAENLPHVLPRIPPWVHEVIVVDDHCTDDTVAVARRLRPDVRIAVNERPGGKGNALRAGFEAVTGDIVVQVDADGSEAPEEIPAFVGALLSGADYAKGTRFVPGGGTSDMTRLRMYGNKAFVWMVRGLFGARFTDLCYGYNAFWARVIPDLALDARGFEIETMINLRAHKAGLKIREVPSFEDDRVHGEGRLLTFPDGWRVLRTIVRERLAGGGRPARAGA
ncbi:MAG TPA: glycosyltransferase family 2 protein [Solirubrobacteraceae bacterium]